MDYFESSELYVYSSAAWLTAQTVACAAYPAQTLEGLSIVEKMTDASDLQLNLVRAFSSIPLALLLLLLALNFNAISAPPTTSASSPTVGAFLSKATPFILLLYFSNTAFYTYNKYVWEGSWAAMIATYISTAFTVVGGLGMLFAGENKAGTGSGWLFKTQEERQRRKAKRKSKRQAFMQKKGL